MKKDRGLRRLVPSTWEAWAAAVFVATVIFGAGGVAIHAVWPGQHLSWRDKVDLACYVGYSDMITASKSRPPEPRAQALATAEERWIRQLEIETGEVPVSELLSYSTFLHDKRDVLAVRRKIQGTVNASGKTSHGYDKALLAAQRDAQFDAEQMGLTICGQEETSLE